MNTLTEPKSAEVSSFLFQSANCAFDIFQKVVFSLGASKFAYVCHN